MDAPDRRRRWLVPLTVLSALLAVVAIGGSWLFWQLRWIEQRRQAIGTGSVIVWDPGTPINPVVAARNIVRESRLPGWLSLLDEPDYPRLFYDPAALYTDAQVEAEWARVFGAAFPSRAQTDEDVARLKAIFPEAELKAATILEK